LTGNLIDALWERDQDSDIVDGEKPRLTLQGAFKPILIQLLLEVDHVSLLEA